MTKILTSAIALELVERIEAHYARIEAIYAEARQYDGVHNDNVIRDAVEARSRQRDAAEEADAYISSFDFDDEGNRLETAA